MTDHIGQINIVHPFPFYLMFEVSLFFSSFNIYILCSSYRYLMKVIDCISKTLSYLFFLYKIFNFLCVCVWGGERECPFPSSPFLIMCWNLEARYRINSTRAWWLEGMQRGVSWQRAGLLLKPLSSPFFLLSTGKHE